MRKMFPFDDVIMIQDNTVEYHAVWCLYNAANFLQWEIKLEHSKEIKLPTFFGDFFLKDL